MEFTTKMLEMLRKPGKNPGYVLSEVGLKFDLPLPCECGCGCWRAAGGLLAGLGELPVPPLDCLVSAPRHEPALVPAQGEPPHGLVAPTTWGSKYSGAYVLKLSGVLFRLPSFWATPGVWPVFLRYIMFPR